MSSLRIILAGGALLLSLSATAMAGSDPQTSVQGPGHQPITGAKFGNCVHTKWESASDPCAPEQPKVEAAPAPVPAPYVQPAMELTHEQLSLLFDFNKSVLTPTDKEKGSIRFRMQ